MNAHARVVAAPVPASSPLDAARDVIADLKGKIAAVETAVARAENSSSPTEVAATAAQGLRQRLKSIFAGMLQAGKLDTATPEVTDITNQLASAENAERQSAAIQEARRSVVADLQSKATELRGQLASAQRALDELLFAAAGADIEQRLIPAYLAAVHQLAAAKGALDGAGVTHQLMAQSLRARGISVQALGSPAPERALVLHPVGFNITSEGAFNTLRVDCTAGIEAARGEFMGRWSS